LDLEELHASLVLLFSFFILNFNSAEAVVFRSSTPSLGYLLNLCDYKSPAKLFVFSLFFLKEPWSIDHHRPLHLGFMD